MGERRHRSWRRRPPSPRRGRAGVVGVLGVALALVLVAAACGSSGRGGGTTAAGPATTVGGSNFGTLPSPCGPGSASGTTAQGVTNSSITIGYGDDAGYQPAPGLDHQMSDAMKAVIAWCNQQGGINGRKVVGNYYDAAVTNVNNVVTEACSQVFMLVGEGWVLDSGQEPTRLACGLPAIPGYAVSAQFSNGANVYQPVPNPVDYTNAEVAVAIKKLFPDKITKSAVVYADYPPTRDSKDKVVQSFSQFGYQFLNCPQVYGIAGESDWKPFAQKLKDCGAEIVYFSGSPYPNFENFLDAANQIGYHPIYVEDANMYDESFAAWNVNGYADNVYVRQVYLPLFEANQAPAIQQYIDMVKASGGEINQLGEQATSAFMLWATAAKACGSNLTRDCVMGEVAKVHDWTGGGLHAAGDPGANMPTDCGLVLKMDGTKYTRVYPQGAGSFDCDKSYVVKLSGPVVDQAHLDANRVAQPS